MTEKDRIDKADLENVAGGRKDTIRDSSPIGTPFGDDAIPTEKQADTRRLTPEEAASLSAGRQAPVQPNAPTFDNDDPPSIRISPEGGPGLSDG